MHEGTEIDEIKAVDDDGAIRDVEYDAEIAERRAEADEYKKRSDFMKSIYDLDNKLRPHGHSVASLFKDFALRLHGIRL